MRVAISTQGRIALPALLRRQEGLEPGDELDLERIGPGDYRLRLRMRPKNQGSVDLLLQCPEKGFFVAFASESTSAL